MSGAPATAAGASPSPGSLPPRADAVLAFWFGSDWGSFPAGDRDASFWVDGSVPEKWFRGGPAVDAAITESFSGDLADLAAGKLEAWLEQPEAAVAGIVLADQFTRNVHRGSARAFDLDAKALAWSAQLRASPGFKLLPAPLRYFACMPLMHSEDLAHQDLLVSITEAEAAAASPPASEQWEDVRRYAVAHRDVVARWGRFPHRNALLGRQSTPEEAAGLADGSIPAW